MTEEETERHRRECFDRWQARQPECDRHVRNLLGMFGADTRRAYLAELEAKDKSMADRVRAEFLKRWEKR